MSREYARRGARRRGGGFPIIIVIIGTLIVITVGVFIVSKLSDTPLFGSGKVAATTTPMPTFATTPTPSPKPSPTPKATPIIIATTAPTASVALIDTSTPAPTPTPAPSYESARIWANKLSVREAPSVSSTKIGSAKYGETYEVVEEKSKWLKIRFGSTYGWVWRDWCVRGDDPLKPRPTAVPRDCLLSKASRDGSTITVTFSEKVWGNEEKTEALTASDFTVKQGDNTLGVTDFAHTAGTDKVTFKVSTSSDDSIKVSIGKDSVYGETSGESGAGSKETGGSVDSSTPTVTSITYNNDTKQATVTFSEDVTITISKCIAYGSGFTVGVSEASHTSNSFVANLDFGVLVGSHSFTVEVKTGCGNDGTHDSEAKSQVFTVTISE